MIRIHFKNAKIVLSEASTCALLSEAPRRGFAQARKPRQQAKLKSIQKHFVKNTYTFV
jgi:hypothetical protein